MGKHTKWRLERKESLAHKLTKEHTYRQFTRLERTLILCIVIFGGTFFTLFGYYQLNVAPFLSQRNDPFTQVWNGSMTDNPTGPFGPPKAVNNYFGGGAFSGGDQTKLISTLANNEIVVMFTERGSFCSAASIFANGIGPGDTQSNTYTLIASQCWSPVGGANVAVFVFATNTGAHTGADTFHTSWVALCNCFLNYIIEVYSGVSGTGQSASTGQANFVTTSGITLLTVPTVPANSIYFEAWYMANTQGCATANNVNGNFLIKNDCEVSPLSNETSVLFSTPVYPKTNQSITWNVGGNPPQSNGATVTYVAVALTSYPLIPCPHGYTCSNAGVDANNLLNLFANSTNPGVAISNSPIDFASAASKELFWFETWNNNSNYVAQPIGWFLTTNQTLATQKSYNPLNDPSIVMVNILYPLTGGKNIYYNYQAKIPGQSLLTSSGAGTNPYPSCPQSSTLFICAQNNINGGGFRDFSMTMNYTGTTGGGGVNGASLTCNESTPGPGPNTYDFCLAAYSPSPCTGVTAVACSTRVFPYLNVNAGPYYIGYWSAANQTGNILFGTSNSGAFDRRANMAFVWVPNPCGGTAVNCTQSTTDTGGFFGWLGHQIGNTFSVVGNTLGGLLSPVLSFGGSLLGSLYSGFVQAVGILIQTYVTVLNFVGNLLHLGNLGDLLLSLLITVGLLITNGLSTLVSWFTSVGTFLTSGWLTFLAGAAGLVPTLLGLALTLWNFVFNANFSVKTLLFADFIMCLLATYKKGLAGFFAWISLNVFLFTFVFNIAWTVFDIITRPIHRAKETVDPVG